MPNVNAPRVDPSRQFWPRAVQSAGHLFSGLVGGRGGEGGCDNSSGHYMAFSYRAVRTIGRQGFISFQREKVDNNFCDCFTVCRFNFALYISPFAF